MVRPIVPRDIETTRAIEKANAAPKTYGSRFSRYGAGYFFTKQNPAFNGSQNNRNNKKRKITLADKA